MNIRNRLTFQWWNLKDKYRDLLTDALLEIVQTLNQVKDNRLATRLYGLAVDYDTRPAQTLSDLSDEFNQHTIN